MAGWSTAGLTPSSGARVYRLSKDTLTLQTRHDYNFNITNIIKSSNSKTKIFSKVHRVILSVDSNAAIILWE